MKSICDPQPMFVGSMQILRPHEAQPTMADPAFNPTDPTKPSKHKLVRQRTPRLAADQPFEIFETRLALSANPGAALIAEAFAVWDSVDSPPPPKAEYCVPVVINEVEFSPSVELDAGSNSGIQPLSGNSSGGDSGAGLNRGSALFDQAAEIRSRFDLTGAGQTVAVIDSGIAWDHVALGEGFGPGYRVVGGWDFAENDANPYDDAPAGFHGSHVSGLIAGDGHSMTGIAPGADLVGLRVFDDFGRSSLDWIESALQWVYDNRNAFESPITTVNLSLGAMLSDQLSPDVQLQLDDELQQLRDGGIVVIAAAGNTFNSNEPDRLNYPASNPNAWAVASGDQQGLSSFSQRESSILAAPGERLISTVPDHLLGRDGLVNDYHAATGTSMSAPQVAAASVLVREALIRVGDDASPHAILRILQDTSAHSIDSATGQSFYAINLGAAITSVLGGTGGSNGEDTNHNFGQPTDIGVVVWDRIELEAGEGVRAIAASDGLFSIRPDDLARDTILYITDGQGRELWNAPVPANGQLDIPVVGGRALTIHSAGGDTDLPIARLQFANVIELDNGHLTLDSGPADPRVAIDLNNGLNASVGEFRYQFGSGQVTSAVIDGGSGADRLDLQGSAATARLILNPYADGTLREGNVELVLRGFEDVRFDGGGGADRAFLYDTRGDDILNAGPGYANLEGVGFTYEVTGVERSYVHATAGGQDVAFLHDSAGDEHLAVRPQFVSLRGDNFFNSANGFEKVYAYATEGGHDEAELYDSVGDDRMSASASSAMISGPGYFVQAREFDVVTGHATAGGNDLANLYSSDPHGDRWIRTSDQLLLRAADQAERVARGFETVQAFEGGNPLQFNPSSIMEELHRRERKALADLFASLG